MSISESTFMSGKLQNDTLYPCLGFMAYCSNFFIKIYYQKISSSLCCTLDLINQSSFFWFGKYWHFPYCRSLIFSVQVCIIKLETSLSLALEYDFLTLLSTVIIHGER